MGLRRRAIVGLCDDVVNVESLAIIHALVRTIKRLFLVINKYNINQLRVLWIFNILFYHIVA
jgi:hypothetical protein